MFSEISLVIHLHGWCLLRTIIGGWRKTPIAVKAYPLNSKLLTLYFPVSFYEFVFELAIEFGSLFELKLIFLRNNLPQTAF